MKRLIVMIMCAIMLTAFALGCGVEKSSGKDTEAGYASKTAEPTVPPAPEPTQEQPTPQPTSTPAPTPVPTVNPYALAEVGGRIKFGGYTWLVLAIEDGKALIITEDILWKCGYHAAVVGVTWEDCALRKYLNDEFYNTFSAEERRLIVETTLRNPDNLWYGTEGGGDTLDRIFLLSLEEADRYFGDSGDYRNINRKGSGGYWFSNDHDEERQAAYEGDAGYWWLRSSGFDSRDATYVYDTGRVGVYGINVTYIRGVRPALWLYLGD